MVNLILGFIMVVLGLIALAAGAFPVTIFLGVSGIIMMIRGALSIAPSGPLRGTGIWAALILTTR